MNPSVIYFNIGRLYLHSKNNIGPIRGNQMKEISCLENAWVWIEGDRFKDYGVMEDFPNPEVEQLDARGGIMVPAFVDAHTHLVFADFREREFVDRIRGLSYQEISERGGGILHSAKKLARLEEDELYHRSKLRLEQARSFGTSAIEIKSGYGLSTESELKILRVIQRLKTHSDFSIRSTFLGAHSFPLEYRDRHQDYIDIIINNMLPTIQKEGLADYMDVFCESGFFSLEETDQLLTAGKKFGLTPRIHTNQFTHSGGIELAIRHQAKSVDHLEVISEEEIERLAHSNTFPVLLPYSAFFMNNHYPPARKMIEAGLPIVIASDYNPGTSPNNDLNMSFGLSCLKMRLLPEEVLTAMTINASHALDLESEMGSITPGKKARFILGKPQCSLETIAYSMNKDWIALVQ
ncbi:MAG: imidazolonepropionase [Saprospiraceae bacterium]|nr:imidazolonepropionase [Saprospiraceae bacterium]